MLTHKTTVILACAILAVGAALGGDMSKSVPKGWSEDYAKAQQDAKASGRLLLLAFSGSDWCGWCIKMDRDIYSQKKFISKARRKFVLVMVDNPRDKSILSDLAKDQNPGLLSKFRVNGFPTSVVARPDGSEITRFVGYQNGGVQAFLAELDKVAESAGVKGSAAAFGDEVKGDDRFFFKPSERQRVLAREAKVRQANLESGFALKEFAGVRLGGDKADGVPVLSEPFGPLARLEKPVYTSGRLTGFTLSAPSGSLSGMTKDQFLLTVCSLVRDIEEELGIKFAVTGQKIDFVGKKTVIVVNFTASSGKLSVQFARKR